MRGLQVIVVFLSVLLGAHLARAQDPAQLLAQGDAQIGRGETAAAIRSFESALVIFRSRNDRENEWLTLFYLGLSWASSADAARGIDYFTQSLELAKQLRDPIKTWMATDNLGNLHLKLGDPGRALPFFQENERRPLNDPERVRKTDTSIKRALTELLARGVQQMGAGDYEAGTRSCESALGVFRARKDREGEWYALFILGGFYASRGDYARGIDYLTQSLELAKQLHDPIKTWDATNDLGNAHLNRGDPARALPFFQENERREGALNDLERGRKTRASIDRARQALGESERAAAPASSKMEGKADGMRLLEEAQALFERADVASLRLAAERSRRARDLFEADHNAMGQSAATLALSTAQSRLNDEKAAIATLRDGLPVAIALKLPQLEQAFCFSLATSHLAIGELDEALEQVNIAIKLAAPGSLEMATSVDTRGRIYATRGSYSVALEEYEKALSASRALKDLKSEAKTLGNVGSVYISLGYYPQALDAYSRSVDLLRQAGDRANQATALSALGRLHLALGQRDKALLHLQQSLSIARSLGDVSREAYALANLAVVHSASGNLDLAIKEQLEALEKVRAIDGRAFKATLLSNLCLDRADAGQMEQALRDCNKAVATSRELGAQADIAASESNLSRVYFARKELKKSRELAEQAAERLRAIGESQGEGIVRTSIGRVWLASGNPKKAIAALTRGVEIWETLRKRLEGDDASKISIFEDQAATYRQLQRALIADGRSSEALEVAERGRARAFAELLARRLSTDSGPVASIRAPDLAAIKQIARQSGSTLVEYSLLYDDMTIRAGPARNEERLLIWVIRPDGEVHFRDEKLAGSKRSLADLVASSRGGLGLRGRGIGIVSEQEPGTDAGDPLQELYRKLIAPIASLLPSDPEARIVFIPQGPLFLAPFPALRDDKGSYLIAKHTVLTSPSIQVLGLAEQRRARPGTPGDALVMGNPTMPSVSVNLGEPAQRLPALPGAERESLAVAPLLKTTAITGGGATKAVFRERSARARVIHLATHGLLDDLNGISSSIALAPDGKDRGLLTADEILQMRLDADLVVLSACDTGRGKITGDGVIGLSRSFLSAGAASVLVSLWSVPDAPTADLMTSFYRYREQHRDKAQALRQAMLETQERHPSPRDWAAFTLIGSAR